MSDGGSDSEDGRESPIFGFSYDEEGKAHSFWAIDPNAAVQPESDASDNGNLVHEKTSQKLMSPPFSMGFSTASGKPIVISENALQLAKERMEPETFENDGTSVEKTCQKLISPPMPVGFSTASGETILISENTMLAANNKMESDTFENEGTSMEKTFQKVMPPPISVGFSTASGKTIAISEKAILAAKKKMESDALENNGILLEKTSQELMPPPSLPNFFGFSTASGKTISVSEKAIEEAQKKMAFDDFNEGKENSVTNIGPVACTSKVFDFGNQSCLSPEESNEVEDLTRSLLEDISASNESDWAEEVTQQESLPVNQMTEPEKKVEPEINAQKARTSTKRRILEQYGEPPDLPSLCTPAKRGRLTKKFVPPRPADSK